MVRYSLRISEELHEKIRWAAYKERRSQHSVVVDIIEKALADVRPPKEENDERTT